MDTMRIKELQAKLEQAHPAQPVRTDVHEMRELLAKAVRWDAIETLMILGDVELKQAEDGGYSVGLDPVENIVSQCWDGDDPARVIDKVVAQLAAVGEDEAPPVLDAAGVAHYAGLRDRFCRRPD